MGQGHYIKITGILLKSKHKKHKPPLPLHLKGKAKAYSLATMAMVNKAIRIKIILFLALFLLVSAGIGHFFLSPWRENLPVLYAYEMPFEGLQKVDENSSLYMTLPKNVDKKSIEETMEAPVEGDINWQGETMIFTPQSKLEKGETYTFLIPRNAKFANGAPLNKDEEYRFEVAGPLMLSSRYPSPDSTSIEPDIAISLVFDRPLIPLSAVQGEGAKKYTGEWPVKLIPDVPGEWRWLGTSTVSFIPHEALLPSTAYKILVPKGIRTVTGDMTSQEFSWTFETKRPQVVSTDPSSNDNQNGPATKITLEFNQEMDLETSIEFIRLSKMKDGIVTNLAYNLGTENKNKLLVSPLKPLELNTPYQLLVKKGIKGLKGELGSREDYILDFSTVGDFKIDRFESTNQSVFIQFSNPADDKSLKDNLKLEPEPEGWNKIIPETFSWSNYRELNLFPNLKPSTAYKLSLGDGIKDRFEQPLTGQKIFEFTTPAISPSLNILSKGEFGIFEKNRPPVYSFEVTNIKRIDVSIAPIPFEDFIQIRQKIKDTNDFKPDLKKYSDFRSLTLNPVNKLNDTEIVPLEIEKFWGGKLTPGIYGLRFESPQYLNSWNKAPIISYQYFSLTDQALTLKYSGNKALIWVLNMETGMPVTGAELTFYNLKGETIIQGKTDQEGFYETTIDLKKFQTSNNEWTPEFWITATKDGDFTFLGNQWNSGLEPWSFGIQEAFHGPTLKDYILDAYLYTERQVYRPGDTAYFKGVTRIRDKDGKFMIPRDYKVNVSIVDATYNEVYKKTLSLNEFGTFYGELPLDQKASLGRYEMTISLLPEERMESNYKNHSFYVLAYRKPEYNVEVTPEKTDYFSKDDVRFNVSGNYYFGAPMNDANVEWFATSSDYWFNRYTDGWYSFSLEDAWCWWNCEVSSESFAEGKGKLDKNGTLKVEFPVSLDDKATSQLITLNAGVTDPNNQVVSAQETVPVHKAEIYVGIQMEEYAVSPNEKARVNLVTVNPDGTPRPNQKITLSLFSRKWNTIRKKSVDGYYYYENEPKDTYLYNTNVTTNEQGKETAELLIKEGGSYRILAEVKDPKGRLAKADTSLYAFSDTYINWPHANNDRMEIVADRPEYQVGDIAKLLIKSPYQGKGVKALITTERENVLQRKVIDITSNAQPLEIPITSELIPNVYVSAVVVKPRGTDNEGPAFKIGYVKLKIETSQKKLTLNVETDKNKYGPGETVTAKINTQDFNGNPIPAEVSLGVVDLSVQALLGFQLPNLLLNFYEERGLGVQTAHMLTYLIEVFKPGSKGGGGGDAESRARSDFKDTAYWNPTIKTDDKGEAKISFKLPDNLTTWQLLAIGSSKDHLFGAVTHEIIETKKTIIRPLRPRFAVEGDSMDVGATVHNFTEQKQDFTVTLDGEGFLIQEKLPSKKVTVKPNESSKIIFPITVLPVKTLRFHFKAQGQNAVDEITESIPVHEFGTPQSVATSGFTEKKATENIFIPSSEEARRGKVNVTLSSTVAAYLPKGLEYLVQFPYGCAEQTVSSFLPNVAVKALQNLDAFKVVSDETLEKNILEGLQKLYSYQRGDGGFGYWSESDRSYPYLTAYIVYALHVTQKAGYNVDENVLFRANNYLQEVLRSQNLEDQVDLTTRAYILYVLAENGKKDTGLLNNLFEKRQELPLFAKAYLAMSYGPGPQGNLLMPEILNGVTIDSRGAHFEEKNEALWTFSMNTNARSTAIILQAMVRLDPQNELIPRIVRYLLAIRQEGHWDTTQSTVASLFALTEFLQETQELQADYKFDIAFSGQAVLSDVFNKGNLLAKKEVTREFGELEAEKMNLLEISKEGPGRLYYDVLMDYFLTLDYLPKTDQGIGIERKLSPLKEDEKQFIVQETYKTTLTITVPKDRHFVAISSPLPAGFEPIDFTLKTSQQNLSNVVNQSKNSYHWSPLWYFNHIEFRDDEVFLFADYLPSGIYEYEYLVRATTSGKFRHRPAKAWEMYYPETFGQTEGTWLEVKNNNQ